MVSEIIEIELGMEKFQSEEKLERYLLIPLKVSLKYGRLSDQ